jgi:hypothetical protein
MSVTPEELAALKADAACYHWMRAAWLEGADTGEASTSLLTIEAVYTEVELDAAIHAAIALSKT